MSSLWFYSDSIDRLHQEALQSEKAARFRQPRSNCDYRHVEWGATNRLKDKLNAMGLRSSLTTKNARFDMWVEGVKVELKAARWHESSGNGRYQATIRNHQADVVIFDCINGTDHWHIIPMENIAPRKSLAVWQYDPAQSSGQWVKFLEQWDHLYQAVETANHIWQPPLF